MQMQTHTHTNTQTQTHTRKRNLLQKNLNTELRKARAQEVNVFQTNTRLLLHASDGDTHTDAHTYTHAHTYTYMCTHTHINTHTKEMTMELR